MSSWLREHAVGEQAIKNTRPILLCANGPAVIAVGAVDTAKRQAIVVNIMEEEGDDVCYVDIVSFGRQAETVAEYLVKGSLAMIEGRLQWRSWETEDGQKRSKHEVIANNVQFLPRMPRDDMNLSTPAELSVVPGNEVNMEDDIPF